MTEGKDATQPRSFLVPIGPTKASGGSTNALTRDDARALTSRIQEAAENLWALLLEAHEGKAWTALGYESWREYVAGEFDFNRQYSYRLIDQGHVIRALQEASGVSPVGDIPERQARRLKPRLPEITAEVREAVDGGAEPGEAVRTVVQKYGTPTPAVADALAKEHNLRIGATDGYTHDAVERDDEAIAYHLEHTYSVYKGLEAMATHPWTPAEYIKNVPEYQQYRLTDHIDAAHGWLGELKEQWRQHEQLRSKGE